MGSNFNTPNQSQGTIPILGSAVGGLRFELVLNSPPEGGSLENMEVPFAILSTTGHFSQTLLARIALGENSTINYFALKMQRNDYPPRLAGEMVTNKQITKLWQIERENLSRFSGAGNEIVELFNFGQAIGGKSKSQKGVFQSKPITFCKRKQVYFHPVCPDCAAFLVDCRDEALLTKQGLPAYGNRNIRYIYCPQCAKKSQKVNFYTYSLRPEELLDTKATIRRRSELYRDFSRIIHNKSSFSQNPETDQFLNQAFPCYSCQFQKECFPAEKTTSQHIPAEMRLTPVAYYEFVMLPLELLHIHYDKFIDLLGGALWPEFEQSLINRGVTSAQQLIINQIRPFFSSSYQFIFKEDPTGLFALEILRLKFIAFTQLCRGVQALHEKCHQPHLDIRPGSVMAKLSIAGRDLPARWNFGIKLLDLGATMPFDFGENEIKHSKCIFTPPHNFQKIYTSPIISDSQFGHEEKMNVTMLKIKPENTKKQKLYIEIEADLLSREIKPADFCKRDLIRISINSPATGLYDLTIWAAKSSGHERGMRISGKTLVTDEKMVAILEQSVGNTFYDTNVAFYKTYQTPCDVYSLGVMLLRTILVNDTQDLWQVMEVIDRMVFRLQNRQLDDQVSVEQTLRLMLSQKNETLSASSVFYRKEDRVSQHNIITGDLWTDILIFVFKLVTNISGFSFCANHGDYDPDNPGSTLEKIISGLEDLNARIHADLFGSRVENKEILEVCDELLQVLENEASL